MRKRFISFLTSLVMVISLVGVVPAMTVGAETSGDYEYKIIYDGTVAITKYNGSATTLSIPSTIAGKKVTVIDYISFFNCLNLKSITIPDSVTEIDDEAFYNCSNLTDVTIGNSVTRIGYRAFENCSSLTSVTIGNGVKMIDIMAFSGCSNLVNITIPNSVKTIKKYAFKDCTQLTNVTIPESVTEIGCRVFDNTLLLKNQNTNVKYVGKWAVSCDKNADEITIKMGTVGIANNTFDSCLNLSHIIIPNSVTKIGSGSFINCKSLTNITLPNNLEVIEGASFSGCENIKNITIPNSVTSIEDYAFSGCANLTSITIGNSVTSIGDSAFSGCSSLTHITIPDSVTIIKYHAFEDCSILKSITIPMSVQKIADESFGFVSKYNEDLGVYNSIKLNDFKIYCYKDTAGEQYAIDNGFVYELLDNTAHTHSFGSWTITKQATCKVTGTKTRKCLSCGKVETQETNVIDHNYKDIWVDKQATCVEEGIISLHCTMCGDKKDTTIIPATGHKFDNGKITKQPTETTTGIKTYTCTVCGATKTETIENYEYEILNDGTAKITKYNGNDKILNIPYYINGHLVTQISGFNSCNTLKKVIIPNSVKSIGNYTFAGCSNLETLVMGNGINKIYRGTFNDCKSLKEIVLPNTINYIENKTFFDIHRDAIIYTYANSSTETCIKNNDDLEWHKLFYLPKVNVGNKSLDLHYNMSLTSIKEVLFSLYTNVDATSITVTDKNKVVISNFDNELQEGMTFKVTLSNGTNDLYEIHTHSYTGSVTKQPTCTETGIRTYTCSCGASYTETILKTAHSYKNVNVNSTYFVKGYTAKKCSVCGTITSKKDKALLTMAAPKASSNSTSSVKLTWSKVSGAKGYVVYQNGKKIKTLTGTSFTVTKLKVGTSYKFTFKPYTKSGSKTVYGNASKILTTSTKAKAVSLKVTSSKKKATLKWSKVTGATGYNVYYKTSSKGKWKLLKTASNKTTSYTKNKLSSKKTYWFKVDTVRKVSGKTYTTTGSTKSVKIK